MNVNPGELNKNIKIIRYETEYDEDNYPVKTEKVIHKCHAKFSRTSGTEIVKSDADFSEVKVRFLIRYTDKHIDRKMAVKYQNTNYEIEYINNYGDDNKYIEIWCKAGEI